MFCCYRYFFMGISVLLSSCSSSFMDRMPDIHSNKSASFYAKRNADYKDDLVLSEKEPHTSFYTKPAPSRSFAYVKKNENSSPYLTHDTYYVVQEGDSLGAIAAQFHHSVTLLGEINTIPAPYILTKGQKLRIPPHYNPYEPENSRFSEKKVKESIIFIPKTGPSSSIKIKKNPSKNEEVKIFPLPVLKKTQSSSVALDSKSEATTFAKTKPLSTEKTPPASIKKETTQESISFIWPIKGKITASFGVDADGLRNEGIIIQAPDGTDIKASADGVVVYADQTIPGYGQVLILSHIGGYFTSYAHTHPPLVHKGDHVLQGDIIAKVGMTGNAKEPQLHFTIRKQKASLDPMTLLPHS